MEFFSMAALAAYVGTVYGANWALQKFGIVSIGFGLTAPAGVFFAGLALGLRDFVQESLGRAAVAAAIVAGAALSWWLGANATIPSGHVSLALASGVAFLLSELADFSIYTPLRERTVAGGIVASNVVGAAVDSALFLWLAFGSLAFFTGQFVGKTAMTVPALAALAGWRGLKVRPA
jgi:queuosine precursor transporter